MIKIDQIYTAYIQAGREHTKSNIDNLYKPYRDTTVTWDTDVINPLGEFYASPDLPIKNKKEITTKMKQFYDFADKHKTKFNYDTAFDLIRSKFPQERFSDNTGEFLSVSYGLLVAYIEARAAMEGKRHKQVFTKFEDFFEKVDK